MPFKNEMLKLFKCPKHIRENYLLNTLSINSIHFGAKTILHTTTWLSLYVYCKSHLKAENSATGVE